MKQYLRVLMFFLLALGIVFPYHFAVADMDVIMPIDYAPNEWFALTYRDHTVYGSYQFSAVDFNNIKGSEGWDVYAIQGGAIDFIKREDGTVVIKHDKNPLVLRNGYTYGTWYSQYSHMKDIPPQFEWGGRVAKGEMIGKISNVHSVLKDLGPHLHFAIYTYYGAADCAISPYWLPGDYGERSLYVDDADGKRSGEYDGKPVYDAMIFRDMPYAPPSLITLGYKQTGSNTVELYCKPMFSEEKPTQVSFIVWKEDIEPVNLGDDQCPTRIESSETITWEVTSNDIQFVPGEAYHYQAYAEFSSGILLGEVGSFIIEYRSTPHEPDVVELPSTNFHSIKEDARIWSPIISTTLSPKSSNENVQNVIISPANVYASGNENAQSTGPVYPPFYNMGKTVSPDIAQWEEAPVKACYDSNGDYWEYYYEEWHKNEYRLGTLEDRFQLMYYYGELIKDGDCYSLETAESWYYTTYGEEEWFSMTVD